jgi:two-component system, OmpR family, phosphate regulon response regulator PhoB
MLSSHRDILVVDDDIAILWFLTQALTEAGYQVRTAQNAAGAIQEVTTGAPRLILLDYAMPKVSGRDVLLQLRTLGLQHVPVIVMSAATRAEQCLQEGATMFVSKPFELDKLLACIEQLVSADPHATASGVAGTA